MFVTPIFIIAKRVFFNRSVIDKIAGIYFLRTSKTLLFFSSTLQEMKIERFKFKVILNKKAIEPRTSKTYHASCLINFLNIYKFNIFVLSYYGAIEVRKRQDSNHKGHNFQLENMEFWCPHTHRVTHQKERKRRWHSQES